MHRPALRQLERAEPTQSGDFYATAFTSNERDDTCALRDTDTGSNHRRNTDNNRRNRRDNIRRDIRIRIRIRSRVRTTRRR